MATEESCHRCLAGAEGCDRFGKLWCCGCWEVERLSFTTWIHNDESVVTLGGKYSGGRVQVGKSKEDQFDPRAQNAHLPVDNLTNKPNKKRFKPRYIRYSSKERP